MPHFLYINMWTAQNLPESHFFKKSLAGPNGLVLMSNPVGEHLDSLIHYLFIQVM